MLPAAAIGLIMLCSGLAATRLGCNLLVGVLVSDRSSVHGVAELRTCQTSVSRYFQDLIHIVKDESLQSH
ncbi:hypothetical protein O6P43_020039 [Quillaja saponaria]|uniref:Secreted protein n=1 Tax=Quillaja saponaria TaxID=32244 RepID=A0AAD7LK58_QUISA|nr:hypothetical protein O6P43_020039 [Quillaja saponaria]